MVRNKENMKFVNVCVRNLSMEKPLFDKLCDKLSALRMWTIDYRMVSDFDKNKELPYWQSCTSYESEGLFLRMVYNSIKDDVDTFCKTTNQPTNQLEIVYLEHQ